MLPNVPKGANTYTVKFVLCTWYLQGYGMATVLLTSVRLRGSYFVLGFNQYLVQVVLAHCRACGVQGYLQWCSGHGLRLDHCSGRPDGKSKMRCCN